MSTEKPAGVAHLGTSASIDAGRGLESRNARMSASSASDTSLSVYGGICARGFRTARTNAASANGFGPIRGPVIGAP